MFLKRRLTAATAVIAAAAIPATTAVAAVPPAANPAQVSASCPADYSGPTNAATGCPWYVMSYTVSPSASLPAS